MEIYIQEKGSSLKKEKNHFLVETRLSSNRISPDKITSIIIEDNILISTGAIKLAIENDVPIFLSDGIGNIYGKVWKSTFEKNYLIRLKQFKVFDSKYGNEIGKNWIIKKIESQKNILLKFTKKEIKIILKKYDFLMILSKK